MTPADSSAPLMPLLADGTAGSCRNFRRCTVKIDGSRAARDVPGLPAVSTKRALNALLPSAPQPSAANRQRHAVGHEISGVN